MYRENQCCALLAMIIVFTFTLGLGNPLAYSGFPSMFEAQLMLAANSISSGNPEKNMNQQLLEKAKKQGTLRVIITLRANHLSTEGNRGSEQAVAARQAAIAEAQKRVLEKLESFPVSSVKRFSLSPNLALEVDLSGLKDLLANPDVLDIQEDAAVPSAI